MRLGLRECGIRVGRIGWIHGCPLLYRRMSRTRNSNSVNKTINSNTHKMKPLHQMLQQQQPQQERQIPTSIQPRYQEKALKHQPLNHLRAQTQVSCSRSHTLKLKSAYTPHDLPLHLGPLRLRRDLGRDPVASVLAIFHVHSICRITRRGFKPRN